LVANLEQLTCYQSSEGTSSVITEYLGSVVTKNKQTEELHLGITTHKEFSIIPYKIIKVC